jgi:hypothetical protein
LTDLNVPVRVYFYDMPRKWGELQAHNRQMGPVRCGSRVDTMSLRQTPTLTAALLAANRRNAQKSTGPRTEEGKRRARLNGLKHGLRSGSFRESLIRSGESTALVDRNFLFLTLCLLPQKRHEVHRIADLVRVLWSVEHWRRRHELRAARPDRLLKNAVNELQLDALLDAAERRLGELEGRCGSATGKSGWQSATSQETSLGPSESELDLLRRTGPILLPGLVPAKPPARPRLVRSRMEKLYEQSRNVRWNQ